jgi:hypothetical protein
LTNEPGGRNQNVAAITDKGKERFFQMMGKPVPYGAHNADIYLIKLDTMQHLPIKRQLSLLDEYVKEQNAIQTETRQAIEDLRMKPGKDHWYAQKKLELRIEQANIAIQWANAFKHDLTK